MALISYLTKIQFDHGAIDLVGEELKTLGVERPMIVTDRGVHAAGLLEPISGAIAKSTEPTIFDETPGNPTEAAVEAALERYKEGQCDGLIAVGGGRRSILPKPSRCSRPTSHRSNNMPSSWAEWTELLPMSRR